MRRWVSVCGILGCFVLVAASRSLAETPTSTSSFLGEEPGYLEQVSDKAGRGFGTVAIAPWRGLTVLDSHVSAGYPVRVAEGLFAGLVKGVGTLLGDVVLGLGEFITSPATGFTLVDSEENQT